jgi:hypothetical protein
MRVIRRAAFGTLLALGACAATGALQAPPADELLPTTIGCRWSYEFVAGEQRWRVDGFDRRGFDGVGGVRFAFAYGTREGDDKPTGKTVWACPASGPRLLFFDGLAARLSFEPPLPLRPIDAAVGDTWSWRGRGELLGTSIEVATLRAAPSAEVMRTPAGEWPCWRTDLFDTVGRLRASWWLAADVGLVRGVVLDPATGRSGLAFDLVATN